MKNRLIVPLFLLALCAGAWGQNWQAQNSGTTRALRSVHFVDVNTGWAVGDSGTILKTVNGGSSWSAESSGVNRGLHSVYFINSNMGWAVGDSGVL